MGILDDAIKEHLELKRQHGADASELKQLEDEAFGAAERPGDEESSAEAPTAFMAQPELEEAAEREPPTEPEPPPEAERQLEPPELAEEQAPAMEHEAIPEAQPAAEPQPEPSAEPEPPSGPSTEERQSIAEQPTELYDVDEELSAPQSPAPTEDELVEEEIGEPRLAPVDPLSGADEVEEEEEDESERDADDFFDEKRLSDELDEALEAPPESEAEAAEGEPEPEGEPGGGEPPAAGREGEEDLLEETPDFLEEAPEDDQLWFEQKPPKDFDFDD
jgi:hypothetical protein